MAEDKTAEALAFYDGAYPRIVRFMLGLLVVSAPIFWLRLGSAFGISFLAGCAVAWLNFFWLKLLVHSMTERMTRSRGDEAPRGVALKFLGRYFLMGLGVYVILKSSALNVYGLLVGLMLPVAAMACEAAYETYVSLRRGF